MSPDCPDNIPKVTLDRRKLISSAAAVGTALVSGAIIPITTAPGEAAPPQPTTPNCVTGIGPSLPDFLRQSKFPTPRRHGEITIQSWVSMSSDGVSWIPPAHIEGAEKPEGKPFVAEDSYFRLHLVSMNLRKAGAPIAWFRSHSPSVMATVTVQYHEHTGISEKTVPYTDAPKNVAGIGDLANIKQQNLYLTPIIPYRGNKVHILAGLVAIDTPKDSVSPFLTALGQVARVITGFALLSDALKFANGFMGAVKPLMPQPQTQNAVCGIETDLDAQDPTTPLQDGYFACYDQGATTPDGKHPLGPENLYVVNSGLEAQGINGRTSLLGINWILFRIQHLQHTRNDWKSLIPSPDLLEMLSSLRGQQWEAAKQQRSDIIKKVCASPDLTDFDKKQIEGVIESEYKGRGGKL